MMCTDLAIVEQLSTLSLDPYIPSIFATINPMSLVMVPSNQICVFMHMLIENGRKIYGPPLNYTGVRPPYACELYINRLPAYLDDIALLQCFHRLGVVYEMRVMMQSITSTRGYAFIRFVEEPDALAACKLFNFLFVNGNRLNVCRSIGKNRLFIGGIPKNMTPKSVLQNLRNLFPYMRNCHVFPESNRDEEASDALDHQRMNLGNRGFAFVNFADHDAALDAKRLFATEPISMEGVRLSIKWAKSKEAEYMGRAFIHELHNFNNHGNYFYDYSAVLRFYCLANNWCVPIVVFGKSMPNAGVQYGAILLKNASTNESCFIIMEIAVGSVYDVHLVMCEIAIRIITRGCGFPKHHYVIRVKHCSKAEIVRVFTHKYHLPEAPISYYFVNIKCIYDLDKCLQTLSQYSSDALIIHYKKSFLTPSNAALPVMMLRGQPYAVPFYAIYPKYRNNPPLECDFNDTEIILLQDVKAPREPIKSNSNGPRPRHCDTLKLRIQRSDAHPNYVLKYVNVVENKCNFYHPAQRVNTHPTWIKGHSYQQSLFELGIK